MTITVWLAHTKEVSFYQGWQCPQRSDTVLLARLGDADDDYRSLDAVMGDWMDVHLPHAVGIDFDRNERSKLNLRRWLAANLQQPWTFWYNGVRFAAARDASLCKLFWGG